LLLKCVVDARKAIYEMRETRDEDNKTDINKQEQARTTTNRNMNYCTLCDAYYGVL
jgi:hypothetical protein